MLIPYGSCVTAQNIEIRPSLKQPPRIKTLADKNFVFSLPINCTLTYTPTHTLSCVLTPILSSYMLTHTLTCILSHSNLLQIPLDESMKSPSGTPATSKQVSQLHTPSPLTTPVINKSEFTSNLSSAFKEPGLPLSALRTKSSSRRRCRTETPKSPEEM